MRNLRGMSIGTSREATTAWIQYGFNPREETVTIHVYRYSWIVWEKNVPLRKFFGVRDEAIEWCKKWKFLFIRERVLQTMAQRTVLKHQDGTAIKTKGGK